MHQGEGRQDTWWRRQFGAGAWADTTSSQRIAWFVVGASGSLVLLGAFWVVLNQALERADQHWERARSAAPAPSPCASARSLGTSGDACAAVVGDAGRRAGVASTRLGSSPR